MIWRALNSGEQFRAVTIHDRKEFVVFDVWQPVSDVNLAQESEKIKQLPESHLR